jgi:hypothetical protein
MLSKTEIEFLNCPDGFNADYAKVLRSRIKSKVRTLREEIGLLENAGIKVTENCNAVTEYCNPSKPANQTAFLEQSGKMVRSPGFEPGSSAWQADVLAKLDYDRFQMDYVFLLLSLKKRYVSAGNTCIVSCMNL